MLAAARDYLAGTGPFPERSAVTSVGARFIVDFYGDGRPIGRLGDQRGADLARQSQRATPNQDVDGYILDLDAKRQRDAITQ
jgi:hypothetical protein